MTLEQKIQSQSDRMLVGGKMKPRRRYRKPSLEKLGELRTLTLGGSPGVGDSGAGFATEFPPADMPGYFPPPGSDPFQP